MRHTKTKGDWPLSLDTKTLDSFDLTWHGRHLGHVTWTIESMSLHRVRGQIVFRCESVPASVRLAVRHKSCKRNISYSCNQIFLKFCRFFCQVMKMCVTFGCNPHISFKFEFSHCVRLRPFRHWVTCERKSSGKSSGSFSRIFFLKFCRYFCQGLKMCMTFGCYPQIKCCYLITSFNLVILGLKA